MEQVSQYDGFRGQCLEKHADCIYSIYMACTNYSILNYISVQCGVPNLACDVNKLYIYYLYLLSFF